MGDFGLDDRHRLAGHVLLRRDPRRVLFSRAIAEPARTAIGPTARAHAGDCDFRTFALQQALAFRMALRPAGDYRRRVLWTRLA